MPPQASIDYEADPRAAVEALLDRLSANPANLGLHKQLWEAALRYKAGGGAPLGLRTSLRRSPKKPAARLAHHLRLWAFDVLNLQHMLEVQNAAKACDTPDGTFEPVVTWLRRKVRAMQTGA